ncbi:YncE family protein [Flammeovirga sp. OC4]|uniref:YncE family protein n=1 Tax=Flammeovirga sp. OC4 TaxID=1382345 RepID=UPI0005C6F0A3|nr:YncE family protein [Flammeovirga sp. OC4]
MKLKINKYSIVISTLIIFVSGYFIFLNKDTEGTPSLLVSHETYQYDSLELISSTRFPVDLAPKSLIHTQDNSKVYVLCLEALSVIEIDTKTKKRIRTLNFKPSAGMGFDYKTRKWVKSIQEKPVEGLLTHNDQYLWISLHNADGVIVWNLKENNNESKNYKSATIVENDQINTIKLPFFDTETTPKFLVNDSINNRVIVSNWHDNSLSIIEYNAQNPSHWKTLKHIPTKVTPRGLVVDQKNSTLWLGNMASHNLQIFDLKTFELKTTIQDVISPRHFVKNDSLILISQSSKEIISAYDRKTFQKKFQIKTLDDPRSIAISNNGQFLFCTSYGDNKLEIFDLKTKKRLYSLTSHGGPVGITLLESKKSIQAWVCNYKFSTVNVFTFDLK